MTPIFFTVLMIAIAMSVSILAILLYNLRREKNTERLLSSFEGAAAEFKLSIAKRQVLGNSMIGYDEANKKLLFLTLNGYKQDGYLVDLQDARSFTVHKIYGPVKSNKTELSVYVEMIVLQLNYKNGDKPLVLPFYNRSLDSESELKERGKQAKDWQVMLTAGLTKNNCGMENRKNLTERAYVSIDKKTAPLFKG